MVKLASHPYNTRSKGKQKMAPRDGNESDNDEEIKNQMTSQKNRDNRRDKGVKTTNGRDVRGLDEWTTSTIFNPRLF